APSGGFCPKGNLSRAGGKAANYDTPYRVMASRPHGVPSRFIALHRSGWRDLLEKLQEPLAVAQWQAKQQTRAGVPEHHPAHAERSAGGAISRAAVEREGGCRLGLHFRAARVAQPAWA